MPFYEIVFETGRSSVACYEDDAEAKSALSEHQRRAMSGEVGGPIGAPAERVAAVYIYDEHPNEFNPAQTMSAEVLTKELTNLVKAMGDDNNVVQVDQLVTEVRGLTHPMQDIDPKQPFASRFKMKEDKKLSLTFLEKVGG